MKEIFEAVARAVRARQPIALVTVIRSIGSTPRHVAAKMAVRADGSCVGTIGGGSMEHKAIQDTLAALAAGEPCLMEYSLIGKKPDSLGLCGGTQEVFIDVLNPRSGNGRPNETLDLFETIVDACDAGEPVALVTIIRSHDGAIWPVGEKALLRCDMSTCGQLSDRDLEPDLLAAAQQALRQNQPVRLGYCPEDGTFRKLDNFSRDPVELFVDVVQPRSELLIIGAGYIGLALAGIGRIMGMRVIVVDDRPEWIHGFPDADEAIVVPYDPETETLNPLPLTITPSTHIVITTWGWDEPALEQVASSPAAYIGLVASRRKARIIFDDLLARGVPEKDLARVRVPAGLDLGAETPQEIALSIMAEILLLQRGATGRSLVEVKGCPLGLRSQSAARGWADDGQVNARAPRIIERIHAGATSENPGDEEGTDCGKPSFRARR